MSTMNLNDESVREMVLGAKDVQKQISDVAELTGLTEDDIKEIAYGKKEKSGPKGIPKRSYDWERLDPEIIALLRSGCTVGMISEKLGIGFKAAGRRCTALRKQLLSGEQPPAPEAGDPAPDPDPQAARAVRVPDPAETAPGDEAPEPLIMEAVQNILRIFARGRYDRIEIDVAAYRADKTRIEYRDVLDDERGTTRVCSD